MAAAGGRRHLIDHIRATPPSSGTKDSGGVSSSNDKTGNVLLIVFAFLFTIFVCFFICHKSGHGEEQEQGTSRERDTNAHRRRRNGGEAPRRRPQQQQRQRRPPVPAAQQQRPAVVAAPPAVDVELAQEPVLECTFRTADGWEETMCSVCQSEMADGEKVRVLTACTHSFHTTCVEEWLREHATCPLCRAPTGAAAAPKAGRRQTT